MAYTYSQLEGIKDRIMLQLETHENNLDAAVVQFSTIKAALTQMQADNASWVTEVNAFLSANPNSEAAKTLEAQKDEIVSEFQTKKTRATALETAVNGV